MKIGKTSDPISSICTANRDTIVVRGQNLCQDLIGSLSFTEYFWLLCMGQLPSEPQRRIVDACLISIAEHGLVPSVIASRMTLAAAPDAIQGAVAAGLLGCGSVILGATESAGIFLGEVLARAQADASSLSDAAATLVKGLREKRLPIPGYGHPLHRDGDPRAKALFDIARALGISGAHMEAALAVESAIPKVTGKPLPMNVSAAMPAVLLDAGFPVAGLKGIPLLARTGGLIAHLIEEAARPIGFALSHQATRGAQYDGALPEGFVSESE